MKITDSVQYLKGVGPKKKAELARLGIATVYDLLTYFPRTYEDQSVLTRIADLQPGTVATVAGTDSQPAGADGAARSDYPDGLSQ